MPNGVVPVVVFREIMKIPKGVLLRVVVALDLHEKLKISWRAPG